MTTEQEIRVALESYAKTQAWKNAGAQFELRRMLNLLVSILVLGLVGGVPIILGSTNQVGWLFSGMLMMMGSIVLLSVMTDRKQHLVYEVELKAIRLRLGLRLLEVREHLQS